MEISARKSNAAHDNPAHEIGHKTENLLDKATSFRLDAIVFFLLRGQLVVAITLFVNNVLDVLRQFFGNFFGRISNVGVDILILFAHHFRTDVAVLNRRQRRSVIQNDLAFRIDLYMIFVSIVRFFDALLWFFYCFLILSTPDVF